MKFLIGGVKVLDDSDLLNETRNYLVNNVYREVATQFEHDLDKDGVIEVAGLRLSPSEILFEVAPEEYNSKLSIWLDNIIVEAFKDLTTGGLAVQKCFGIKIRRITDNEAQDYYQENTD